jgi:hypothetical protein
MNVVTYYKNVSFKEENISYYMAQRILLHGSKYLITWLNVSYYMAQRILLHGSTYLITWLNVSYYLAHCCSVNKNKCYCSEAVDHKIL